VKVNGKMIEKGLDLCFIIPKICPTAHLMEEHAALYPHTLALLGTYRIVPKPHRPAHFIQESARSCLPVAGGHTRQSAIQSCRDALHDRRNIDPAYRWVVNR
jgi:hypothetical protein